MYCTYYKVHNVQRNSLSSPNIVVTTWCGLGTRVMVWVFMLKFKLQYGIINLYRVTLTKKMSAEHEQNWQSRNVPGRHHIW